MTRDEFIKWDNRYAEHADKLQQELYFNKKNRDAMRESYEREAFEQSEYEIGQQVTDELGRVWFVSGAHLMRNGEVYLSFVFPKKDGTMSKVSGLGRGEPYIRIR